MALNVRSKNITKNAIPKRQRLKKDSGVSKVSKELLIKLWNKNEWDWEISKIYDFSCSRHCESHHKRKVNNKSSIFVKCHRLDVEVFNVPKVANGIKDDLHGFKD